ncbi:MAG: hypothetical protein ABI644_11555 [Arenimonas sp.]
MINFSYGGRSVFMLLLLSGSVDAAEAAAEKTKPVPSLGGSAEMEITCEPMPGESAGHFVCEDPDSFKKCKALEGKGKVRVDGDKKETKVLVCVQGG